MQAIECVPIVSLPGVCAELVFLVGGKGEECKYCVVDFVSIVIHRDFPVDAVTADVAKAHSNNLKLILAEQTIGVKLLYSDATHFSGSNMALDRLGQGYSLGYLGVYDRRHGPRSLVPNGMANSANFCI